MTIKKSFFDRYGFSLFLIVFAVSMTLKFFPGLENEDAYAGLSYQAIYPDAMSGDIFYGPQLKASEAQYRLSAYYLLPKLFGKIWLDDRFVVLLYLLTVVAAMYFVDRISVVLGAKNIAERALIMILVLKDNEMLGNKVLLAHHPDFNHSALAIPIALWLYYLVLSRKNIFYIFSIALLLAGVSIKNAVFPVASSLIIMSFTRPAIKDRRLSQLVLLICFFVAVYGVFFLFAPPESERLTLWNYLVAEFRKPGNPFYAFENSDWYSLGQFSLFLVFSIALLKWPTDNKALYQPVRIVVFMTLLIWFVASAYISYAPDFMKFPTLLPFSWNSRALQFPQILMYIALPLMILRWVDKNPAPIRILTLIIFLAALFLVAPKNVPLWFAVLIFSISLTACGCFFVWKRNTTKSKFSHWLLINRTSFAAISLSITLAVSLLGTTVKTKIPAWKSLIEYGVFGDAASATWIHVAPWINANTDPSDPILTFILQDNGKLKAVRSLATRTGRPQTKIHRGTRQFDADTWQQRFRQDVILQSIAKALVTKNYRDLNTLFSTLIMNPAYLILPRNLRPPSRTTEFPFILLNTIDNFDIYRKAQKQ